MANKVGRNDPCPCGSGKKYKQCCLKNNKSRPLGQRRFKATVLKGPLQTKQDAAAEVVQEDQSPDLIERTHAVQDEK